MSKDKEKKTVKEAGSAKSTSVSILQNAFVRMPREPEWSGKMEDN